MCWPISSARTRALAPSQTALATSSRPPSRPRCRFPNISKMPMYQHIKCIAIYIYIYDVHIIYIFQSLSAEQWQESRPPGARMPALLGLVHPHPPLVAILQVHSQEALAGRDVSVPRNVGEEPLAQSSIQVRNCPLPTICWLLAPVYMCLYESAASTPSAVQKGQIRVSSN